MIQADRMEPPSGPAAMSPSTVLGLPTDACEPDPAYRAALEWIWSFSAHPMGTDPRSPRRARKLERMRALLAALGNPQECFPAVLVAGTKGKGSVAAFISAALRAGGIRAGRYTSPHLVNWRERTWVDGSIIEPAEVLELVGPIRAAVDRMPDELGPPTTFEVGTALSLLHFARREVDVGIVEAGVGGLTDATNSLDPLVSVVTSISYDHTEVLGPTLREIARHKAGIARPGRALVSAPQEPEPLATLLEETKRIGARLTLVGRDWGWACEAPTPGECAPETTICQTGVRSGSIVARVGLPGDHQRDNATVAAAALAELANIRPDLAVDGEHVRAGLETVDWPGRLQVLRRTPLVVVDGAHNGASARAVAASLRRCFEFERLHLVVGLSAEKDAPAILGHLAPGATTVWLTRSHHERARDPHDLGSLAAALAPEALTRVVLEPADAFEAGLASARASDLVLITGSLFLVGEALDWARRTAALGYAPAGG